MRAYPLGRFLALTSSLMLLLAMQARAEDGAAESASAPAAASETEKSNWGFHMQSTNTDQYVPGFQSPYQGGNSLNPHAHNAPETIDFTAFAGVRLWEGAEFWANPEMDQGFGVGNTLGLAGFSSGDAYKIGQWAPYARLQRAFLRQTFSLGGDDESVESDFNQLAMDRTSDKIILTIGKFSVPDIFDTNLYAHDPRSDFLNWSVIEAGTFDYAADSWGFSYGGAMEWYQDWWTLRQGLFTLSNTPNSKYLTTKPFNQFQDDLEYEVRYDLYGLPSKFKVLGFAMYGHMATYNEAIADGENLSMARHDHVKTGGSINLENPLSETVGLFLRAGYTQGQYEAYDFTDINRTVSGGASFAGKAWGRADDTVGFAVVTNGISRQAKTFFAAGGLGVLVGDGLLLHSASEHIFEAYYSLGVIQGVHVTLDYQLAVNPAYNVDRGPVNVFGIRNHLQF